MKSTRELLEDMLASIEVIQSYSLQTYELFIEDDKTQDAIMYNLIILGEAANRISNEFQEEHSEIPWSSIIGKEMSLYTATIKSNCKSSGISLARTWDS